MANGLMPPKFLLEKVVRPDQRNCRARRRTRRRSRSHSSKFPASFSEADKTRLKTAGLAAIKDDVLPAYAKFAKFVKDEYVPKGRTEVGVWSLPNGDAIYAFEVQALHDHRQDAGRNPPDRTAAGRRDRESSSWQIANRLGFKDLKSFREVGQGESQAVCAVARADSRSLSQVHRADETRVAQAVRASAEGRLGGDAGGIVPREGRSRSAVSDRARPTARGPGTSR